MEAITDHIRREAFVQLEMDDVNFLRGYIATADVLNGTLTVALEDGSRISGVKMLFQTADGTMSNLNTPDSRDTPCLVMVVGKGAKREAFCIGVYARTNDDDSSPLKSDEFVQGDQGWLNVKKNAFIALRRNGVIDLKAGEVCRIRMNPKTNKVQVFGFNLEFSQGPDNGLTWTMIEDPVTGAPSKSKLEVRVKPDLSKSDVITMTMSPDGVSLNTSLDVNVDSGGDVQVKAQGKAHVIGEKIIANGELAVGAEEASKHLPLAEDVKDSLTAIADALETVVDTIRSASSAGPLAPLGVALTTFQTTVQVALRQGIDVKINAVPSQKHTIDG